MTIPFRHSIAVTKLQHHVFYVTDLARSKDFYMRLLDLQFSALNHPDSSAAMRLSAQEMHFFSFGYYHHDLCLVKHHRLTPDDRSMLHFTLVPASLGAFEQVRARAARMGLKLREGRFICSSRQSPQTRAFCLQDPDGHWLEFLLEVSA